MVLRTLSGSQIEVKVNNVGAVVVASGRAKLGHEVGLKKAVGGDTNRVAVKSTSLNTVVGLDVPRHPLHHHFRRPALVLHAIAILPFRRRRLQQTPFPRRCYRERAHVFRKIFTQYLTS